MYSGSDSNESQKYANWALNPANYKNVPGEQVDWAALAQQWIIMKEAGPPPIPGEQPVLINKKTDNSEGGEAEMDVENDKEGPPPPPWGPNDPPGVEPWNWPQQNQSWNSWGNPNWMPPSGVPPPVPNLALNAAKTPLLPTPSVNNSFTEPPESSSDNATPFGSGNPEFNSPPYWNNSSGSHKHIKPHNKRYSKVNVPIRASAPLPPIAVPAEPAPQQPQQTSPTIDNAKRKQLPAWIREGLEKMEKDKLKQMERQQKEKEERDTEVENRQKQTSEDTIEILKTTIRERQKSRFESDEENSNENVKKSKKPTKEEPVVLSHEELMLKVRRTMTEILLNVTNRLIEGVCKEELQRYLKHNKASEAASAPSAVNVRGRLGLGIYGGDDSGSSSTNDSDEGERDVKNSDDELRDTIKKKMAEFQKIEREIEGRLEEAERQKIGSVSRSSTPESNDNDSQVEARPQGRKSKPKPKQRSSSSSSSQNSDYSNNKSKTSHRSSSTDSKDSYRRKSSKKRSVTPDKRAKRRRSDSSRKSSAVKRNSSSSGGKKSTEKIGSKRRSRSRSYSSRSRRSRSSSSKKYRRSRSRERARRSRSSSRSRYSTRRSPSSSRSDRRKRRRSRSESSGRGKRSYRH